MKVTHLFASAVVLAGIVFAVQAGNTRSKLPAPNFAKPATAGSQMSKAERLYLTRMIAYRWGPYVQKVRKIDATAWARSMGASFALSDPGNLRRAAGMQTYEGMVHALLGRATTDDKIIDTLAKSSSVATLAALASPGTSLVYNAVSPCRIVDTRETHTRFAAKSSQSFETSRPGGDFISQGGAATDCGIPADPAAIAVNVAVVQASGGGFITMWPFGETMPLAATVNNVPGSDINNLAVAKLTVGDVSDFSVYSFAAADIVIDVVGYYSAGAAAGLDCVTANGTQSQVNAGSTYSTTATCPAGYTVTGGGARVPGGSAHLSMSESYPSTATTWYISGHNASGSQEVVQARAQCCRVPGL